jgi:mannose-6-phosphate isomerase-like protein (cupin superfamily)
MPRIACKSIVCALALMFAQFTTQTMAQSQANVPAAAYISNSDFQAALKMTGGGVDRQVRVVDINNGEYHVGVGIVHRPKASASPKGGIEHSDITEVYHILEGSGTLLTGGSLKDIKQVKDTTGPSRPGAQGSEILNGTSQKVGPGDVIIIPPNTPHLFTEIGSEEIVYVVVRPDPHKILPVMSLK